MSAARLTFEREPSPDSERLQIESRDRVNDLRELLGRSPSITVRHRSRSRRRVPTETCSAGSRSFRMAWRELRDRVAQLERRVGDLQRGGQRCDAFTPDRER